MPNTSPSSPVKSQYDVVIIGAGIAGLTVAALLSKMGLTACILEMDVRPGGYLAGFKRKDFRFDSAIHWLNQCGPDGLVTRLFDFIGTDHPRPKPQTRIKRYKGDSFDYLLTNKPDDLKDQLIQEFPYEKEGIIKFFKAAKKIGAAFDRLDKMARSPETMGIFEKAITGIKKLQFAIPFIKHIRYTGDEGVTKGLNQFFKDEKLHRIFSSETELLSCLVPIGWAYYGDYQSPPEGGSQVFPEWLSHVINSYDNDILYRSKVTEIIVNDNECQGVKFEHRGKPYSVKSKYVVAACDVETLYEKMLPSNAVPPKLLRKLRDAELYSSSVTISLALDCPAEDFGFDEEMIYLCRDDVTRDEHCNSDPYTSGISILAPSLRDKSMAPEGCGTLTLYAPASFDYQNNWNTDKGEDGRYVRGEAYKKFKNEYADILIKRVEEKLAPGLSEHILFCDVATPITHWRYTGNKDGTIMGARPGRKNMQAGIAHYKTPIKNLYLGGHWAELGGGVPIAIQAALNASLLVAKHAKLEGFKLLANYMDGKISLEEALQSNALKDYDNSWLQKPTPAQKAAMVE